MTLQLRRIVTGHNKDGKAIVMIDEMPAKTGSARAGVTTCVAWTSEGFPIDNSGAEDESRRQTGTWHPGGTVFRIIEFAPGNHARNHRTDSLDYAVVMSGEIDMTLDDGVSVHVKAGDAIVQRGTIHNWLNRGTEPCVIAFVLIDAKPVIAGGKVLNAVG